MANEHGIPSQIFYDISDNTRQFWSIVNAQKVIGYAPEDNAKVKYARILPPACWGTDDRHGHKRSAGRSHHYQSLGVCRAIPGEPIQINVAP
jgi:hypothetical protein